MDTMPYQKEPLSSIQSEKQAPEVIIVDCGPRDGLASVPGAVPTEEKLRLITALANAGLKKIDSVAFTHPRVIPKDSDAENVMRLLKKKPGVTYIGLAPSEMGCRRAVDTPIDEVLILVAASPAFSKAALGQTTRDVINKTLPTLIDAAAKGGKLVRAYVLTAFGCPYAGEVESDTVVEIVSRLDHLGTCEISLVDNTGMANPLQVKHLAGRLLNMNLGARLAVHFHDTRGMAMANTIAAYEAGIRTFDTAVGGLSGTPFGAPKMELGRWNVATEDLVHTLECMGVHTGVNLEKLLACVDIAEKLAGRALPGHILRSGPNTKLSPIPEHLQMR
jgi:hydroxymethylglutaryl-CoA lyase